MYRGRFLNGSEGALITCAMLGLVFSTTANAEVAEKPAARATVYAEVQPNISTGVAIEALSSSAHSRTAMGDPPVCAALPFTDCDGQIGILGYDEQQCGDGGWLGTAYPIQTGLAFEGATVDTLTFTVNTNFAGGDIHLMLDTDEAGDGCNACQQDINGDGIINAVDLAGLLACWGPVAVPGCECFDVNSADGINPLDLATLLGSWGPCPPGPEIACQPDTTRILASLCCAVSGLETAVAHELHFDPVDVPASGKIWVVFVGRSGQAGTSDPDDPNSYDGDGFPGHQVARECEEDAGGACTAESTANNSFANLVGSGNPGDWTDLHDLGDPPLGTPYCVELSSTGQDPAVFDCIANPDPVGACCFVDEGTCTIMEGWRCGVEGGVPGPNPAVYEGDGSTCDACEIPDKACTPEAGDCCNPDGNGTPGCDNNTCCISVCSSDPFCCEEEWEIVCADIANDESDPFGCATGFGVCAETLCAPMIIATGSNDSADGYLSVELDRMGSWAHPTFGGGTGDPFNPAGPEPLSAPMFGSAIQLHSGELKEVLSCNDVIRGVNTDDIDAQDPAGPGGLIIEPPTECELPCTSEDLLVASDVSGNGVDDTLVGAFTVSGSGMDLFFETFQQVLTVGGEGSGVSTLTQSYTITNNGAEAVEIVLLRLHDLDQVWGAGSFADDVVGTTMNGAGCGGTYVYQLEDGQPETALTLSSTHSGGVYFGSKGGLDPDNGVCTAGVCVGGADDGQICFADAGCVGPAVPFGFGTDNQEWDAGGVPPGWENIIAHVPDEDEQPNENGESGPTPEPDDCAPCDGKIGLAITVSLEPGATDVVTFVNTYGQTVPAGCE